MTDPRIQVSTTADRVIAHDVLDDLAELDRHTESIGDGIAMRLDGPLPTAPGDRKPAVTIVPDSSSSDRAILTRAFHHLG
jgi:hypothetical protein